MYKELDLDAIRKDLKQQIKPGENAEISSEIMARGADGCSLGSSVYYNISSIGIRPEKHGWVWYVEGGGPEGYWITLSSSSEPDCPVQAFPDLDAALQSLFDYLEASARRESSPDWGTTRAAF